jgi:predicted SnoaL-like aldol condensation-catalyzing enzyme
LSDSTLQRNKAFVLEAFETLFNRKDFVAAEKFWSPNYIQHSAHIPPGRDGLFGLVKSTPPELKYENSLIMAEGDMLMLHGRFSGIGRPANWSVVDIVWIKNGLLAEHWDVIQDEATEEQSKSKARCSAMRFPPDDLASGHLPASSDCTTIEPIRDLMHGRDLNDFRLAAWRRGP